MFGMFKRAKDGATKAAQKFSGNTDFLEAVCASAALIAAADGTIEDSEIQATQKAISANRTLADNFDARAIEKTLDTMLNRAGGGRVGRASLWTEIEEALSRDTTGEMAEALVLTALDVAEGDGSIEEAEQRVLTELAKRCKVDLERMMAA